jgi:hypothetical protein
MSSYRGTPGLCVQKTFGLGALLRFFLRADKITPFPN